MIEGAGFDHVALAGESRAALGARYRDELGGRPLAEGPSAGFVWAQVAYANGAVVEMLEPERVEENDFLRRFLDRNGPGPHHMTFTVPRFETALREAAGGGYPPVAVDDSHPDWKEAFLHPKDAPGVVVQLAESHEEHHAPPAPARSGDCATFLYVAHAVRALDEGLRLFERLLGGARSGEGGGPGHRWVELAWSGPGRLRLVEPTGPGALEDWLGGRVGRVHHLAFALGEPGAVAGAHPGRSCSWVEPAANHGTRLLLVAEAVALASEIPL